MKFVTFTATAIALAMAAGSVYAKVSPAEAAKLGTTLTAKGAEKAGNAAGTIPAYTGGLAMNKAADPYVNAAITAEKSLFVIDGSNVDKYKANLSEGQVAMFKKYPDTFKMPVYKTHRTASYPAAIEAKAKANATTAELVQGGNGLINFDETVPFAIPKNGVEAIWNHVTRFRGGASEQNYALIPVQNGGNYTPEVVRSSFTPPQYLQGGADAKEDNNILFYYTAATRSPARLTGNVLLVHETIDQVKEPRKAWQYNAGQRRVRRAPQVAYDAPNTEGMRTSDQVDMYNGSPDRYNWKLVGKKEMYIPYNAYKLGDRNAKYADIVGENHINPEFTRYELHRVWHVEATLKEGARHIYSKRDLYLDEDSWQVVVADHYDSRGNLWRVAEGHALQFNNIDAMWYAGNTNYDLSSGRYMAQLFNEENDPLIFNLEVKRSDFSTAALRRSGKR
jgi:hypothetical protein